MWLHHSVTRSNFSRCGLGSRMPGKWWLELKSVLGEDDTRLRMSHKRSWQSSGSKRPDFAFEITLLKENAIKQQTYCLILRNWQGLARWLSKQGMSQPPGLSSRQNLHKGAKRKTNPTEWSSVRLRCAPQRSAHKHMNKSTVSKCALFWHLLQRGLWKRYTKWNKPAI